MVNLKNKITISANDIEDLQDNINALKEELTEIRENANKTIVTQQNNLDSGEMSNSNLHRNYYLTTEEGISNLTINNANTKFLQENNETAYLLGLS
ncbi:hypothetical protein [Candidatus Tisiphia endosymbiont of Nemotelus uliginosus]|uniref:hypothetical protein n=1 Tax=Candidatus Tisiphia endosymbiont of Nemotelus uliginosus TaxID=3077926 RepID=UPI0035C882AB